MGSQLGPKGGGAAGEASKSGDNIVRTVVASGIHRLSLDQKALTHGFERVTFTDYAAFRAAYGLEGADESQTADAEPADNLTDFQNFEKQTDPLAGDTDGDGLYDDEDPEPLVPAPQARDIVFGVNMKVQWTRGYFNPSTGSVTVKFFSGVMNGQPDLPLTDEDQDGVYSGKLVAVAGMAGTNFGEYKFFNTTPGAPNSGYETSNNRNFPLGIDDEVQALPVVNFSNDAGAPFDTWAGAIVWNGGNPTRTGNPDGDADDNLREFLFGGDPLQAGGALTSVARDGDSLVIRFFARYNDSGYTVQESAALNGDWQTSLSAVIEDDADQTGVPAGYVRRKATVPVVGPRGFFRVAGQ